jgi:hypothetical protein
MSVQEILESKHSRKRHLFYLQKVDIENVVYEKYSKRFYPEEIPMYDGVIIHMLRKQK